jgi:hypothetical protein
MANILYVDGSTTVLPLGFPVELRPQAGADYSNLEINVTAGGSVSFSSAAMAESTTVNVPTGSVVTFNTTTGNFEVTLDGAVVATLPVVGTNQSPAISVGGGDPVQVEISDAGVIDDTTLPVDGGETEPPVEGQTFTLTTGADVLGPNSLVAANKTGDGSDTIYALTASSLTSADIIDGGNGTDSIIADYDFGGADAGTATPTTVAPVLTSVENITIRNTGVKDTQADLFTLNTANSTGIKSVTFDQVAGAGTATTLSATALASSVATVGVTNNATLAHNYTFQYADAAVAGTADAVTVNVTGNSTATGTVLIRGTTSTTAGAGVETVTVKTTGTGTAAASTIGTLLSADGGGTTSVLKTLNVTGTSALTINASVDFAGTDGGTIVATGMSGDLTLTATTGNEKITFTGGSGKNNITTADGNDTLTGGTGDDTFTIGAGDDTVVGGAGNDRVVITGIAQLTAKDSIALGEGTRDTLAVGTWTALTVAGGVTAGNKALIDAVTGLEVIELTAGNVTAVDYDAITQNVAYLTAANTTEAIALTNVTTGDVLRLTADSTDDGNTDQITVTGKSPNQEFVLELNGTDTDLTANNGAATNAAVSIAANISKFTIDSSAATASTANTNSIAGTHASAVAIENTSTQNFVITGNQGLVITGGGTALAGFSTGADINASTFTGPLTLNGSTSADNFTGGTGVDTIRMLAGVDNINISSGGADVISLAGITAATDRDIITGFTTGVATGADKVVVLAASTSGAAAAGAAIVIQEVTTAPTAGLTFTTTNDLLELSFEAATGTGKVLADSTDGTALLASLGQTLSVTTDQHTGFIVAYQAGKAYLYYAAESADGDTALAAGDIALIGVFNDVAVGSFQAGNFTLA